MKYWPNGMFISSSDDGALNQNLDHNIEIIRRFQGGIQVFMLLLP